MKVRESVFKYIGFNIGAFSLSILASISLAFDSTKDVANVGSYILTVNFISLGVSLIISYHLSKNWEVQDGS